jgi:CelD/BcsL family acetyltransferase involved in cellulose biosynthesis
MIICEARARNFSESSGMSDFAVLGQQGVARVLAESVRAGDPVAPPPIDLAVFDELDAVEAEWRRFEANADCTPFQTFDWLDAWQRNVGCLLRARPAVVVGRRADGEPLFLFPLAVVPGIAARLTWLGNDLCDYNAPLLAPDFSRTVPSDRFPGLWQDIVRLLQSRPQHRFDLVELTKMPPTVGIQPNPFMTLRTRFNPSNAYVADLPGSWDQFYEAKRSSSTRRRDRTKLKKLGEFGEVRFVIPLERAEIGRTMDALVEQKARSLTHMGAPNMFARPGWRAFYLDVAINPRTRDLVHVSRLDVGSCWAAINLGLAFRDGYYHVLASYDDGEVARFGPGVAHLRELLRFAIERGLRRFDFTIGDERYKLEWSDRVVPLHDHVAAVTLRGWPKAAALRARRRVKRTIKQNEVLWSFAGRLRPVLGGKFRTVVSRENRLRKSPPIAPE